MATANVLGVFAHVDTATRAIRELRAEGFSIATYSPVPLDEFEEAIDQVGPSEGATLHPGRGLTGTATGFALTIWTALKWDLITGRQAAVSIPPFIVIAFELTILLGGLCSPSGPVLGPPAGLQGGAALRPPVQPGSVRRRGGVPARRGQAVQEVLRSAGAEEVRG